MEQKFLQYRDFYNQSATLPIHGFRGTRFDVRMFLNFFVFLVLTAVLLRLLPGTTVFGIQKIWIILDMSFLLTFLSYQVDTKNVPFFTYMFFVIVFSLKKLRGTRYICFTEVRRSESMQWSWNVPFFSVIDTGKELLYDTMPLSGSVDDIRGLSLSLTGATQIQYRSLTKTLRIRPAKFEQLNLKRQTVGKTGLDIEVGRGNLKVHFQGGESVALYTPTNEVIDHDK